MEDKPTAEPVPSRAPALARALASNRRAVRQVPADQVRCLATATARVPASAPRAARRAPGERVPWPVPMTAPAPGEGWQPCGWGPPSRSGPWPATRSCSPARGTEALRTARTALRSCWHATGTHRGSRWRAAAHARGGGSRMPTRVRSRATRAWAPEVPTRVPTRARAPLERATRMRARACRHTGSPPRLRSCSPATGTAEPRTGRTG